MPERLDFGDILAAHVGKRLFGELRRYTDAQASGHQLEEGEARRGVQVVEHVAHDAAHVGAPGHLQALDGGTQRDVRLNRTNRGFPDERDRFGEVADIVVGVLEEHRVHAFEEQVPDHRRLDRVQRQRTGDRRERVAAARIRRRPEVIGKQADLGVALRAQDEAIEQFGEGVHPVTLPRRRNRRGAAGGRRCLAARTSAPVLPRGRA
ncbi:hypothetical protein D9M72_324320 [compost metagenome]